MGSAPALPSFLSLCAEHAVIQPETLKQDIKREKRIFIQWVSVEKIQINILLTVFQLFLSFFYIIPLLSLNLMMSPASFLPALSDLLYILSWCQDLDSTSPWLHSNWTEGCPCSNFRSLPLESIFGLKIIPVINFRLHGRNQYLETIPRTYS